MHDYRRPWVCFSSFESRYESDIILLIYHHLGSYTAWNHYYISLELLLLFLVSHVRSKTIKRKVVLEMILFYSSKDVHREESARSFCICCRSFNDLAIKMISWEMYITYILMPCPFQSSVINVSCNAPDNKNMIPIICLNTTSYFVNSHPDAGRYLLALD